MPPYRGFGVPGPHVGKSHAVGGVEAIEVRAALQGIMAHHQGAPNLLVTQNKLGIWRKGVKGKSIIKMVKEIKKFNNEINYW